MTNRRETLKIIGAISATCTFPYASDELYGQHVHVAGNEAAAGPPVFFKKDEFETVSKIADLIIPRTNTAGAIQAGVPSYIDLVVSRNDEHQSVYRLGLAWVDAEATRRHGKTFARLTDEQQIALLTPLSEAADADRLTNDGERFFRTIKNMTADGYYTSKAGMTGELGYKGGAVLAQFPTCEVPEH